MLGELVEVVTKLFEVSDSLKQARGAKRQRIVDYFHKIEECLQHSAEELREGRVPHRTWGELRVYAWDLPNTIGLEIGQDKANELAALLKATIEDLPDPNDPGDIEFIETAAGRFRGLAVTLSTQPYKREKPINSVNRRIFTSTAAGTVAGLTAGWLVGKYRSTSDVPEINQFPRVSWQMQTFLSDSVENTILFQSPEKVCNLIKKMTGGHFEITLERTGETEEILKKVDKGQIQCGYGGIYYSTPTYRPLFFGCAIPFGLNLQEQIAWLSYKKNPNDEFTYIQSIYKDKLGLNVIPFLAGTTGSQMGGWFKEKVTSINDLKGKVMRIPGLGAEVLQKLGMTTHDQLGSISVSDAVDRLQTGKFSSVEWTGPYDDMQLDLHKAAKFYYYPGWWEPSTTFDVQVNIDAWKKLPPHYQEIFKAACHEVYMDTLAEYEHKNSQALKELQMPNNGVELVKFSNDILEAAQKATEDLLKFHADQEPNFKEVYDEWRNFKEQIRSWSKLNHID
jgi:TRAP-type mannitol/chloroaromatic compound transport system substrate-binding protein